VTAQALQITARGLQPSAERGAEALDADKAEPPCAYSIIEEDEGAGVWRIDAYPASEAQAARIADLLTREPGLRVETRPLADADWLALALSGLPPVRAGRFFVYGAHDRGRVPANAVALRIEAGAAFGTGHHGSTLGCLLALDALLKRRWFERVLDLGTGTGVLAIAAAKTGSRRVAGTDIDPVAVRIARENARLNETRAGFAAADGLGPFAPRAPVSAYDLVFANILAAPIVRLAPLVRRSLRRGGVAILSGLLKRHERAVVAAYLGEEME